jgi:hypothetical protein
LRRATTPAVTREAFAAQPFGFELTSEQLRERYSRLKQERYLTEDRKTEVLRFHKGKTELLFRRRFDAPTAQPVEGAILTGAVQLMNGVRVGMSRKEFFWRFSDWTYDEADMLTLAAPAVGCTFHFSFTKDKLTGIRFVNREEESNRYRRRVIQ